MLETTATTIAIASALKVFGPTIAKILLTHLIKDQTFPQAFGPGDVASSLVDSINIGAWIGKLTGGDDHYRYTSEFLFRKIGREAAAELGELFKHEGEEMDEADVVQAIEAAQETLNRRAMPLLLKENLNPHAFGRTLRKEPPAHQLDTEAQIALYQRILGRSAELIFAVADGLPHFTRDTTAKLLENEQGLLDKAKTSLAYQRQIMAQTYGQVQSREDGLFEGEYRTTLANVLDRLVLFGVDQFDGAKQPLSVAYIRLRFSMHQRDVEQLPVQSHEGVDAHGSLRQVAVEEALASGRRLLIRGKAGSGKTTLLKWLAVQAARGELSKPPLSETPLAQWASLIPFYVRLRDYADKLLPTQDRLANQLRDLRNLTDGGQWPTKQLRDGRGLILLDGLDEVSDGKRQEALDWVDQLLAAFPQLVVIISSRPDGLNSEAVAQGLARLDFRQLTLEELDKAQVTDFVKQWHLAMQHKDCLYPKKSIIPEKEEELLAVLKNRPELMNLTQTPLLCAMICALHLIELGELPHERIQLYTRCIHILLHRDVDRKIDTSGFSITLSAEQMQLFLARIAYWMLRRNPHVIMRTDAESLLCKAGYTHNATQVLQFLAERSVIFRQQAADEFDFIHRTFLEFLAAKEIVRDHDVDMVARDYATKSEWHETIRLLAAHTQPEDQVTLLDELYQRAQAEPSQKRDLHLLAWSYWDLLGAPTELAKKAMYRHVASLNIWGATALDLRGTSIKSLTPLEELDHLQALDLGGTGVTDLRPLAKLVNLQTLNLLRTKVTDLKLLAKLTNLQTLRLSETEVTDLKPLAKLANLQTLNLSETEVTDLKPLAKLANLQTLNLSETEVTDLKSLAKLANLQELDLNATEVANLIPLQNLTNLQKLDLSTTKVTDLMPLRKLCESNNLFIRLDGSTFERLFSQLCKFSSLHLDCSYDTSLTLLAKLTNLQRLHLLKLETKDLLLLENLTNLESLSLSLPMAMDLAPLTNLSNLQTLMFLRMKIEGLIPLEGMTNLRRLILSSVPVNDLIPLKELPNLQDITLHNTKIEDLTLLKNLTNLQTLILWKAKVKDLTPLKNLTNLQVLDLSGTEVKDLTPLENLTNLQTLNLRDTEVKDLTPLRNLTKLRKLKLTNTWVNDLSPVMGIENLRVYS